MELELCMFYNEESHKYANIKYNKKYIDELEKLEEL